MNDYADFLARKTQLDGGDGFEPIDLPEHLYGFQTALTDWAVRAGRAAIFADCGLGKTPMALAWADQIHHHTGKPVLIITPLAVTFQIEAEATKFGLDAAISRTGTTPAPIVVTNYERLEHFNPDTFGGVVCDESSAIKAFDGQRRALVTEFLRTIRYRLLATATAAPNDYIELGTASEALGHLGYMDMLGRFFVNQQKTSATNRYRGQLAQWRFKGHAQQPFWRWVASWARACRRPSDLGFDDDGFVLPELVYRHHVITARTSREGTLFDVPATGLHEEREELRRTVTERCEQAAALLTDAEHAVAWCHLNAEGDLLTKLIDGAVQVSGADPVEVKEETLAAFSQGKIRVLVTKPAIGAWGLNWQHCNRMTYFPSHSYEQFYQAIRRCWRYGQTRPVTVDVVSTEGGRHALANLQRKATAADVMFDSLTAHMRDAISIDRAQTATTPIERPTWLTQS